MLGIWIAVLSGALMKYQGVFNTEVTKQSSLWVSTGWVQLSAFVVCVIAWFCTGRESIGTLWQVEHKYTLLGGVIGAFITITVIKSMGESGTGTGNHVDCNCAAGGIISGRNFWPFRSGATAF